MIGNEECDPAKGSGVKSKDCTGRAARRRAVESKAATITVTAARRLPNGTLTLEFIWRKAENLSFDEPTVGDNRWFPSTTFRRPCKDGAVADS